MKACDKELIFNLLKNASAHFNGYTKDVYKSEHKFIDDEENQSVSQNEFAKPEQNVVANSEQSTIKPPIESQTQVQVQSQNEGLEQLWKKLHQKLQDVQDVLWQEQEITLCLEWALKIQMFW